MGFDIYSKGYQSYVLFDYRHQLHIDFPSTVREYFNQITVWIENSLIYWYKNNKLGLIKFLGLFVVSLYCVIFPFLIFINFGLFLIGLFILLHLYLAKIRKLIFFKAVVDKQYYQKFGILFYLKILYSI